MNQSYCILPFISVATDTTGDVVPCCVYSGKIVKADGTPYNLGVDTLSDIRQSKSLLEIQNKMRSGEKLAGCANCYQTEENGGISYRLSASSKHKFENKLTHTDIRFGNTCNLACRSCHPNASSSLAREVTRLQGKGYDLDNYKFIAPKHKWYLTDTFNENINELLTTVNYVYLTGGESTLLKKNIYILERLIEMGRANEVNIEVSSNIALYNVKFFEMLPKFKNVLIQISLDGYGPLNDYIRYPSKWSSITENIERLLLLSENIFLVAVPVIQIYNLNRLTELYEYLETINRKLQRQAIYLSGIDLQSPSHLDILYLPKSFKMECYERLATWKEKKMTSDSIGIDHILQSIKAKSLQEVDYIDKLSEFVKFTSILDKNRNMMLEQYNPELYTLLREIEIDSSFWS